MQVFKAYFKVMRASRHTLLVNFNVFLAISLLFSFMAPAQDIETFEPTLLPIGVIDRDGDTLSLALQDHLSRACHIIDLPDEQEALQDALFYRRVEYIALIPPGFSRRFIQGEGALIEKVIIPNSASSHYADLQINQFLNTAQMYLQLGEKSQKQLAALTSAALAIETKVQLETFGAAAEPDPNYAYYFRYCAYALLAIIISGISAVMISFNEPNLNLRNLCSPLPKRRMNQQLLAGHAVFALVCWLLLILVSLPLYGSKLFGTGLFGLYAANSLAFTAVCVSIAFLVGDTVKTYNALAGSVQVIALGMNFLGGVFVPQSLMSKPVLAVAKFLPSFWYVKNNDLISALGTLTKAPRPFYHNMFIQLGFAVAITAAGLLFRKERSVAQFAPS